MSDSCPIKNWTFVPSSSSNPEQDVGKAIAELSRRGVGPDPEKPWEAAATGPGKCSPEQIDRFGRQMDFLRFRFKEIPPERIIARMKDLKGGERDHWAGMIHYWALRDEAFLKSVRTPALESIFSGGLESCVDREERLRQDARTGYSEREAELMIGRGDCDGEGATFETYASRFDHLRYFRESYEKFLAEIRSGQYSSESFERGTSLMNMVSRFNVRAVARGSALITEEDLQRMRRDAEGRDPPATAPVSWSDVENLGGSEVPLIFRPSDLPAGANGIQVGPFNLFELLLDTVDYIVLLPGDRFREFRQDEGDTAVVHHVHRTVVMNADAADTPGKFLISLAHEVAHRYWFDLHLVENPARLSFQGPNERFAYAFELGVAHYFTESFDESLERVQNANVRLGLERGDFSLVLWSEDWNGKPSEFFQFYPERDTEGEQ